MNQITLHQPAVVFVDYDHIYESLKRYGIDPLQLNFFPLLLDRLKNNHELDVIEAIVYADFEVLPPRHQTYLRQMGLTTRHCTLNNGGSLILAVDAVVMLYDNPAVDVFVIITGLNDIIPILSAIRYKNKFAYAITLKENFDPNILPCTDYHEYLDDIFGFAPQGEWRVVFHRNDLTYSDIKRARKVARLFYDSHIWKKAETTGEPVTLKGYVAVIKKAVDEDLVQLQNAFELAHFLKYVTIYQRDEVLYLKKGDRYRRVMDGEP